MVINKYGHALLVRLVFISSLMNINPFAPGDFAEKRVFRLVEWFSGGCRAIKS